MSPVKFLGFVSLFLLLGCSSTKNTQKIMDSWLGATVQSLIMSWGPPHSRTSDGANGEVLTFVQHAVYRTMNQTAHVWTYTYMYADAKGIIYRWMQNKSPDAPNSVDVRIVQ